jgi:hypothetical protein
VDEKRGYKRDDGCGYKLGMVDHVREGRGLANVRYMLFYPLMMVFTPSSARAVHPILFALQAPVRYGPIDLTPKPKTSTGNAVGQEVEDPRRSGVAGGDVVRDCAVIESVGRTHPPQPTPINIPHTLQLIVLTCTASHPCCKTPFSPRLLTTL